MISTSQASELQDIHHFLQIVLSESNYQLQDLKDVKYNLGTLMYGFSLLHDSNSKLTKDSNIHYYKLKNIIETLDDQQNTIDMLSSVVEALASRQHPCGGTGWVKVVDLDMANPSHTCPTGWQETGYSKRTCGRVSTGSNTCDPASFPVGMSYSQVCGRIAAYQVGNTNGFSGYIQDTTTELTENYADGVVLYYGTPAEHI